jgi:hypothetical protein
MTAHYNNGCARSILERRSSARIAEEPGAVFVEILTEISPRHYTENLRGDGISIGFGQGTLCPRIGS